MSAPRRVVLLIAEGPLGHIVANDLARRWPGLVVIEEQPESKARIIKRRARLLGWPTALSQAACGLALRVLSRRSVTRAAAICREHGLVAALPPQVPHHRVASINAPATRALLTDLAPDVVAVYGTRILSRATLAAIGVPVINYHAGINPKYRGQHPAYWALSARDPAHAGVTIHLVDEGVDTGAVLHQRRVEFSPRDTIATYQLVQMAAALPLLARAIEEALDGRLAPHTVDLPSRQYFPPTLGQYVFNGCLRGVW